MPKRTILVTNYPKNAFNKTILSSLLISMYYVIYFYEVFNLIFEQDQKSLKGLY